MPTAKLWHTIQRKTKDSIISVQNGVDMYQRLKKYQWKECNSLRQKRTLAVWHIHTSFRHMYRKTKRDHRRKIKRWAKNYKIINYLYWHVSTLKKLCVCVPVVSRMYTKIFCSRKFKGNWLQDAVMRTIDREAVGRWHKQLGTRILDLWSLALWEFKIKKDCLMLFWMQQKSTNPYKYMENEE